MQALEATRRIVREGFEKAFPDERISDTSDFFELGGDSMALVALCSDLEAQLGRDVHPSLVLHYPTVTDLSAHLNAPTPE